jgi:AcrR family transcriptional regulator
MAIEKRRERERERRRQQIIAASRRVFTAKGFSRTTVKDIAREAELSPGTIYIYFKSKDELYAVLSIRMLKHLNLQLHRVQAHREAHQGEVTAAVKKVLCEAYRIDPPLFITLSHLQASEMLENISPELLDQITDLSRRSLETLADLFAAEIDRGAIAKQKPYTLALILWGMFSGLILWEESKRTLDPRKDFLEPTLDTAFEILRRGVRPAGSA